MNAFTQMVLTLEALVIYSVILLLAWKHNK